MMFTKSECKPNQEIKKFFSILSGIQYTSFFWYYNEIYVSVNKRLNPSGIKIAQRRTDSVLPQLTSYPTSVI